MEARIVIVGGGVMGVSIAWHAAMRADPIHGPVVLFERTRLAAGSSGRSGAVLRQFYSSREVAGMARDSLQAYSGFERSTGRSIGFQRTGVLTLVGPDRPEDAALLEANVAMMSGIGIDVRRVDADTMRRIVPGISVRDGSVGAYEPGGGGVDPVATVEALAAVAREKGAVTRVGEGVRRILFHEGAVSGVETDAGRIEAGTVVLAAGPWTRSLLRDAGVDLPLRVVAPEQHFLSAPAAPEPRDSGGTPDLERAPVEAALGGAGKLLETREVLAPAAHPVILDLEQDGYLRCETHACPEGFPTPRVRVGRMSTSDDLELEDPDAAPAEVRPEFLAWARRCATARIPEYRDRPDAGSYHGLYTLTPDSQALIGPVPGRRGLFVVSGFSGHGFKLAPSIGEGVAQMLFGEPVSAFDVPFFAPDRFRDGAGVAARTTGRGFGL